MTGAGQVRRSHLGPRGFDAQAAGERGRRGWCARVAGSVGIAATAPPRRDASASDQGELFGLEMTRRATNSFKSRGTARAHESDRRAVDHARATQSLTRAHRRPSPSRPPPASASPRSSGGRASRRRTASSTTKRRRRRRRPRKRRRRTRRRARPSRRNSTVASRRPSNCSRRVRRATRRRRSGSRRPLTCPLLMRRSRRSGRRFITIEVRVGSDVMISKLHWRTVLSC